MGQFQLTEINPTNSGKITELESICRDGSRKRNLKITQLHYGMEITCNFFASETKQATIAWLQLDLVSGLVSQGPQEK